jgi:hypothetical protein
MIFFAILGEKLTSEQPGSKRQFRIDNVITGRASVKLSRSGYILIFLHQRYDRKRRNHSTLDLPRLIVPMSGTFGALTVHLALRENLQRSGLSTSQMAVPNAPKLGGAS